MNCWRHRHMNSQMSKFEQYFDTVVFVEIACELGPISHVELLTRRVNFFIAIRSLW